MGTNHSTFRQNVQKNKDSKQSAGSRLPPYCYQIISEKFDKRVNDERKTVNNTWIQVTYLWLQTFHYFSVQFNSLKQATDTERWNFAQQFRSFRRKFSKWRPFKNWKENQWDNFLMKMQPSIIVKFPSLWNYLPNVATANWNK